MYLLTLAIGLLLPQELIYRFDAPREFSPAMRHEFQTQMKVENYERLESKWKANSDPKNVLPVDLKQKLFTSSVALRIQSGKLESKIDRIGISVETKIYKTHRREFDELRGKLEKVVVQKTLLEVCNEISTLSAELNSGTFKLADGEQLSVFAEFHHQELAEGPQEFWMLMDVVPTPKDWPAYPSSVLHQLYMRGLRTLTQLEPHPNQELIKLALKNFERIPLEPNRPSPKDKFGPPIPELQDDGLSCEQRELLLGFTLIDDHPSVKRHQVEMIVSWPTALPYAGWLDTFQRRIPAGRVLTYDEIHLICGELASKIRSAKQHSNLHFVFTIRPEIRGKNVYSKLELSAINNSTSEQQ